MIHLPLLIEAAAALLAINAIVFTCIYVFNCGREIGERRALKANQDALGTAYARGAIAAHLRIEEQRREQVAARQLQEGTARWN